MSQFIFRKYGRSFIPIISAKRSQFALGSSGSKIVPAYPREATERSVGKRSGSWNAVEAIRRGVLGPDADIVKWSPHFSPRDGNLVRLLSDPDYDDLSDREREALDRGFDVITELIAKHGLIADFLHKQWPEWRDPEGTAKGSLPLEPEDVIGQAIGEEDEIERITREIQRCKVRKRLFRPAETLEYWGYVRVVSDGGRGSLVDLDL